MTIKKTAAYWVKSFAAEAKAWRAAADGTPFLLMINRALDDQQKPNRFGVPPDEILTPAIRAPDKFFDVPNAKPKPTGKFFDLPPDDKVKEIGATFKGLIVDDWLDENGFTNPSWEEPKPAQPTKAAQTATYFSIPTENA